MKSAHFNGRQTADSWQAFRDAAHRVHDEPPYHLVALFTALRKTQGARRREELRILDHGCGGGLTCLLLLANGYTGVYGIDLESGNCDRWNDFLNDALQLTGQRFFLYDGARIPLEDDSVDFVFSQQVIEHVRPDVLAQYYSEEYRVLRDGGGAFHEVPHKLTPYESHTRIWLLHYLPRRLWLILLDKALGIDTTTAREAIFLRWPWVHKRAARSVFGNLVDLTTKRLKTKPDAANYDGPIGSRLLLFRLFTAPVVGDLLVAILSNLVMMQTYSTKTGDGNLRASN